MCMQKLDIFLCKIRVKFESDSELFETYEVEGTNFFPRSSKIMESDPNQN